MEEFSEVRDLIVDDLLVVEIMIWLKVDSRICDEQKTFYFNEGQNLLYMELPLELRELTNVLKTTLIELDLSIWHNASSHIAIGCIIETLGHLREDFLNLSVLIMELIAGSDVRRKQKCDGLEEIVDVSESNVDV